MFQGSGILDYGAMLWGPGSDNPVKTETPEPVLICHSLPHILLVDDEQIVRQTLGDYLRDSGCHVVEACDSATAVRSIEEWETTGGGALLELGEAS